FESSEGQVGEVSARLEAAHGALESAASVREGADVALERVRGDLGAGREQLEASRAQRAVLQVERAGLESKVEALLDRDRELEDLSGGARRVLEAAGESGGPCHQDDLLGLVADQLRADTRLARAIDAVLGERAHALVARDAHVARRIVDWCDAEQVGQVGVVIPPGVGAPDCPPPSDFALFARFGAGVEGRLGDLVQCDESMRPLVHALFCDVVVVSSLDLALDLVGREPGWRFVTPRGEFVDAAGLVGGHRELSQGFVGRRSSAAEFERSIAALASEIEGQDRQILASEASVSELQVQLATATEARDAAVEAHGEAESLVVSSAARLSDLQSALETHREERAKAQVELARVQADLEAAQAQKLQAAEAFEAENARLEQMEKGRRQLEAEREDLQREEGRAQVELSSATAESSGLEQRIGDLGQLITETAAEIERSKARVETYSRSADDGRADIEKINVDSGALTTQQEALDARLEHLREEERSGAQRITEIRREAESVQGELDRSSESLASQRLEAQAAELGQREVVGRADEELGIGEQALREAFAAEGAELMVSEELESFEKQVATVRAQLDRLGPVNVDAVHELEEVGSRLDHLETQASDLAEARRALRETISTIDEESRRLFVETFEEVRGNFQQIFRLLFGGGKADIRLEEGVDVLEAGVEIVARPPGRELLAIGLLSGGQRTMTALALLFAVFEARPSPFCVLDEVDAALDDANIDRFLGMLDRFRKTTQFIVVTHNKGTMAASQALYGVTMQVKGVSRFVAVELDEVDEFAPESTGKSRNREAGADPLPAAPEAIDESGEPVKELAVHRPEGTQGEADGNPVAVERVADEV
ncbi:MAG: AAA family ATPase, partial [Planctomycetota bacterium]|nr:AAA family ATPase [Planctomycetota bacterium]